MCVGVCRYARRMLGGRERILGGWVKGHTVQGGHASRGACSLVWEYGVLREKGVKGVLADFDTVLC